MKQRQTLISERLVLRRLQTWAWLPLALPDWCNREVRTIGMLLNGAAVTRCGPDGERLRDDSFLVVIHAGADPVASETEAYSDAECQAASPDVVGHFRLPLT